MVEPVALKVEEVTLVTIIMPNGSYVPVPLVVLNNDSPLYEETLVDSLDRKFEAGEPLETEIRIVDISPYNDELLTITITSDDLENDYQFNIQDSTCRSGKCTPAF